MHTSTTSPETAANKRRGVRGFFSRRSTAQKVLLAIAVLLCVSLLFTAVFIIWPGAIPPSPIAVIFFPYTIPDLSPGSDLQGDDFWIPVLLKMKQGYTSYLSAWQVNISSQSYVPHYILQELERTGKTLYAVRGGHLYTLSGPELAARLDVDQSYRLGDLDFLGFRHYYGTTLFYGYIGFFLLGLLLGSVFLTGAITTFVALLVRFVRRRRLHVAPPKNAAPAG